MAEVEYFVVSETRLSVCWDNDNIASIFIVTQYYWSAETSCNSYMLARDVRLIPVLHT